MSNGGVGIHRASSLTFHVPCDSEDCNATVAVNCNGKNEAHEEHHDSDEKPKGSPARACNHQIKICEDTVNPHCKVGLNDFEILQCIGRGGYGKVCLVRKVSDGPHKNCLFAMKVLKKAMICRTQEDMIHTWSERNILQMIRHPFLVKLHYAFQTESNLSMILEYCPGGELFNYLDSVGFVSEKSASFYISEVTLALGHLHSFGIIYRDLKPENILLDKQGHIRLTDFGLSKEHCERTNTYCGTKEYMAPEIYSRQFYDKNVDWWCLGSLLYDMLAGCPPFQHSDKEALKKMVLTEPVQFPESFSDEAVDLIDGLLQKEPRNRLGAGPTDVEEIKQHSFFARYHIIWDDVLHKRLEPPFKPHLDSETDTSLFDPGFTSDLPNLTPVDRVSGDMFRGFSYQSSGAAASCSLRDGPSRSQAGANMNRMRKTSIAASESSYSSDASDDSPKHGRGTSPSLDDNCVKTEDFDDLQGNEMGELADSGGGEEYELSRVGTSATLCAHDHGSMSILTSGYGNDDQVLSPRTFDGEDNIIHFMANYHGSNNTNGPMFFHSPPTRDSPPSPPPMRGQFGIGGGEEHLDSWMQSLPSDHQLYEQDETDYYGWQQQPQQNQSTGGGGGAMFQVIPQQQHQQLGGWSEYHPYHQVFSEPNFEHPHMVMQPGNQQQQPAPHLSSSLSKKFP